MTDLEENNPLHRKRRRPRQRFVVDTSVASPCLKICQVKKGDETCVGCLRSMDEIRYWIIMSREEKLQVLDNVTERKAKTKAA
jgi:predicted Fe-S protein YdhL (DUF1289 family)